MPSKKNPLLREQADKIRVNKHAYERSGDGEQSEVTRVNVKPQVCLT